MNLVVFSGSSSESDEMVIMLDMGDFTASGTGTDFLGALERSSQSVLVNSDSCHMDDVEG